MQQTSGQRTDMQVLGGGDESGGSGPGGAVGVAALEMQRRQLEEAPEGVVQRIRANMPRALRVDPNAFQDAAEYWR
eukprot:11219472-Lingulodinium_polyedra.AAC.1